MTDKQIIIDGTHCRYAHFDGGNTQRLLCAIDDCFCDCYRDNECYYKQLKRAEKTVEECHKYQAELEDKFTAKEQECEQLTSTLTEIKFWARELLKRTGQVVPYEIKQILQKISECEGNDENN
jgi:hypothetical protein